MTRLRRLTSPGPIAEAFLHSRAFICGIIGPVGSGKTMTAAQKLLRVGAMQGGVKDERTGITRRRARCGVIRESYPNIEANVLKSWFNLVPEEEGKFNWRAPYVHTFSKVLRRDREDNRPIDILDMEVEFRAIGDKSVEEITRGWEINAAWIDEYDLQPPQLLSFLTGRVGRFSDMDASLVVDPQIIASLNMPYIDNHAYKLLVEEELGALDPPADPDLASALNGRKLVDCFIQPDALSESAENIHNLPNGRGYYVLQAAANKNVVGYSDRMIRNKPIPMQYGQPVNPNFSYVDHVREGLEFDPRRKLIIGMDQGLFAAAVAMQRDPMGNVRTLRERVFMREDGKSLTDIGPTAFGMAVKAMLAENFPDVREEWIRVVCDPAAFNGGEREDNEIDWVRSVKKALGLAIHKAKSNSPHLRNSAIWNAHSKRGGYLVDKSCKHLIKGHLGGYRYAKAEISASGTAGGEVKGHLEIANTIYTHVADAEQYAALEGEHVISDTRGRGRRDGRTVVNDSQYDVLGGNYA